MPNDPSGIASDAGGVGLAFNLKRNTSDDAEAEFDSPATIAALTAAIESYGHRVVPLEATAEFPRALMAAEVDLVFNVAEGARGRNREAQVPSLCEMLGIACTGSDAATLSICLDKALCKRMLRGDVQTPAFRVLTRGDEALDGLRYPVIVKPSTEGSSKGISKTSVADDEASTREKARDLVAAYGQPAIVEEYVEGREFTVGMLGDRLLPPMEVVFLRQDERPVYDYACKQDWPNHVRYQCPADLTARELSVMQDTCKAAFAILGCRDVARADLRMAADGSVHVIEVNPLPGLTPDHSDLCLIANAVGLEYRALIGEILSAGLRRASSVIR